MSHVKHGQSNTAESAITGRSGKPARYPGKVRALAEVRDRIWEYLLRGIPVAALAAAAAGLLGEIPVLNISEGFYLLYFAAFFLAALLFHAADRKALTFRTLPAIPITVLLISRDPVLFSNATTALVIFVLLHLLREATFWKWGLCALTLLMLVLWFFLGNMPGYAAVCLIFLILSAVSEFLNRQSLYWAVLLSAVVGVALAIPSSEEPMRWEGIRGFIGRVGDFFETAYRDTAYFFSGLFQSEDTAYSGYSEAGRLGGGLSDSDWEALTFESSGQPHSVYLTGASYAKLSPEGFTERAEDSLPVNAWFATYLSGLARSGVTREEASCFSKVEGATVTYQYIRTADLLIPSTVFRIDPGLEYGSTESRKKGFTYTFNYIAMDQGNPYFTEMAKKPELTGDPADYEEAARIAKDFYGIRLSDYMTEEDYRKFLKAYQDAAESPEYLDTSMVTDRMRQLAGQLTEGCDSDLEKADRIEAYLRQYTYDLSVDLRGSENYVDSFLFEVQRGYCVHYASAMVLLLRESGIPSRFIQGFLYDPGREGKVLERDAHAWVEAYIRGLGWIRFEPTAAYENATDAGWGLRIAESAVTHTDAGNPKDSEQMDVPKPPEIPVPRVPSEAEQAASAKSIRKILLTVGFYLLTVIAAAAVLLLLTLAIRRIRYARMTPERKVMADMGVLRRRLDAGLPEGVTVEGVFEYLPYIGEEELRNELEELFRGYYRVRFRKDAAEPAFVAKLRDMSVHIRKRR